MKPEYTQTVYPSKFSSAPRLYPCMYSFGWANKSMWICSQSIISHNPVISSAGNYREAKQQFKHVLNKLSMILNSEDTRIAIDMETRPLPCIVMHFGAKCTFSSSVFIVVTLMRT